MNESEIDRHIVEAFAPALVDPDALARAKARAHATISTLAADKDSRPAGGARPRVPRSPRVLFAAAALASLTTIAVAQPGRVAQWFGDEPRDPANNVVVLRKPSVSKDAAAVLDVFQRPDKYPDRESEVVRDQIGDLTQLASPDPEGWGEALPDYMRTLLVYRSNGADVRVVGVPTTRGYVCYVTWIKRPKFTSTGSCVAELGPRRPVTVGLDHRDGSYTLSGIAMDHVVGVDVEFSSGAVVAATMGSNAYIWRGGKRPAAIRARLVDDSELRFDVSGRALKR